MPRTTARRAPPFHAPVAPPRAAPVAVGLDPPTIIAAALDELDRDGFAAFSLRGLARRLGVNASVIVWHVGSRDVLLAEVVALVLRDVVPPDMATRAPWQDRLRTLFVRFRAAVRRHPNAAPLIGADAVTNVRPDLTLVEAILSALVDAGFADDAVPATYNAVQAALVGFVTQEFARMPTEDVGGWQEAIRAGLATADAARHPHLVRLLPTLANRAFILRWQNGVAAPMEDGFAAFVDCVIAGLEAQPRHR